MAKKLGIALGSILVFLVLVAVLVPFFVDVDKYRPQIVAAANEKINGSVEIGKLTLSLWGQVKVGIGGLKVLDADKREVLAVSDAHVVIPLLSIVSGQPLLKVALLKPTVHAEKSASGKLNLLALMKPAGAPPPAAATGQAAPAASGGAPAVPALVARAAVGLELRHATLTYKDATQGLQSKIEDLNLVIQDLSLTRKTQLELWADLNTKLGKKLTVAGPARLKATAQPSFEGGELKAVAAHAVVDLDGLAIEMPGTLHKKAGVPANASVDLQAGTTGAKLNAGKLRFHTAELDFSGDVKLEPQGSPVVRVDVHSNSVPLSGWDKLLAALQGQDLNGTATLTAAVKGPSDHIGYQGQLQVKDLKIQGPAFKAPAEVTAKLKIATDQLEQLEILVKAPGTDLKIDGKVVGFEKPRAELRITSRAIDLDAWLVPSKKSAASSEAPASKKAAQGSGASEGAGGAAEEAGGTDAAVAPLRKNPVLVGAYAKMSWELKQVKTQGVLIQDVAGKVEFGGPGQELVTRWEGVGLRVFDGTIESRGNVQLRPAVPQYQFSLKVAGLDMKKAMESQMELFKDTVYGKAHFDVSGFGASLNSSKAKANLKAKGSLRIEAPEFTTIDIMKSVGQSLNGIVSQLGDKVPVLKGKSLGPIPSQKAEYESVSSDFTIEGGRFVAPNFFAKPKPQKGFEIRGNTVVGLLDQSVNAQWEVLDTYNLTHARDLDVPAPPDIMVKHILVEEGKSFRLPLSVGCTLSKPCVSYTHAAEEIGKVALSNLGKAGTQRAKQEAKKQVGEALKNVAPPAMQDALKGLFGN